MVGRRVLLIAFHFPPIRGSSGVQRTLRFAQYLPEFGWEPIVLTIDPRAYPEVGEAQGNEIPAGLEVHRAFGLDAARQLKIGGKYPGFLAVPDRWRTWGLWGARKALRLARERDVQAVWSTFPIATAHAIGREVARRSGLPWVAEFRDPMWQGTYPPDPVVNRAFKALESEVVHNASRVVLATRSAMRDYRTRFASLGEERFRLIENGYDEETFARAEARLAEAGTVPAAARPGITLLHSGVIYPSERDPSQLFAALAELQRSGWTERVGLRVVLRATGHDAIYQPLIERHGLGGVVQLAPGTDYLAALAEMLSVDGLLLLQAANCNAQVPAKLYEYVRAGRPILALTDPAGDTAATLREFGVDAMAALDSSAQIAALLQKFVAARDSGAWPVPSRAAAAHCSRRAQTADLAGIFDTLADAAAAARGVAGVAG